MDLLADFLHFGASDFPSKNPFKKCFKIVFFFALASRSGFGATISDAVARSSIGALQLSLCRSHCNGCVKVASCCGSIRNTIVFCSWISEIVLEWLHEGCEMSLLADFLHFGTSVFLLDVRLEQCEVWGMKSAV